MVTRITKFLLVVLCAASVSAQSMRRDSLRLATYDQLLIASGGNDQVTSARFNRIFSRGLNTISTSCPAYEKLDTVTITVAVEGGALNSDFVAAKSVSKILGQTIRIPLQVVPYDDTLYNLLGGTVEKTEMDRAATEHPRYYSAFKGTLFAWPKYNRTGDADSFLVEYYAAVPDVGTDTAATVLSSAYREALINYCCSKVADLQKDYGTGRYYWSLYLDEIKRRGMIGGNNIQAAGGYLSPASTSTSLSVPAPASPGGPAD